MKLYKLTDQDYKTRAGEANETVWGENVTHTAKGKSNELCSDGLIHAYTHPILAVLFNPIHAEISNPVLWECETDCKLVSDNLKCGVKTLTTVKQISLPGITLEQKIAFAILCAKKVSSDQIWNEWADKWLNGKDRSIESAREAEAAGRWEAARRWTAAAEKWAPVTVAAAAAKWAADAKWEAAGRWTADAKWEPVAVASAAKWAADAAENINLNFLEIAKEAGITYEENL